MRRSMKTTLLILLALALAAPGYVIGAFLTETPGGGVVSAVLCVLAGCWIAYEELTQDDRL